MPIITARTYSRAVVQDREIADVIAVNEAHEIGRASCRERV